MGKQKCLRGWMLCSFRSSEKILPAAPVRFLQFCSLPSRRADDYIAASRLSPPLSRPCIDKNKSNIIYFDDARWAPIQRVQLEKCTVFRSAAVSAGQPQRSENNPGRL